MPEIWARHQRMGDATRAAVKAWGMKLLCKEERWNSNALTVLEVPEGINSNDIVKTAYCKYNLTIGVGLSKVLSMTVCFNHVLDMANNDHFESVAS